MKQAQWVSVVKFVISFGDPVSVKDIKFFRVPAMSLAFVTRQYCSRTSDKVMKVLL